MEYSKRPRRPGDLFIDRYMPAASEAERKAAYENLRGLVALLVEIDDRIARERGGKPDSRDVER